MKKLYFFILGMGVILFSIFPFACGKNISPTSNISSSLTATTTQIVVSTATPTATVNSFSYTSTFQNSVSPTSTYSGELDVWMSGQFIAQAEGSSPYLQINTATGAGGSNGYTRSMVQFTNISLPVNTTIIGAEVWMTLESATNVSGAVTVGAHTFSSSVYPSCEPAWTNLGYWQGPTGIPSKWSTCDGDTSFNQEGFFNQTPNSTVVFSSSANGTSGVYRFTLNASDVQAEILTGIVQFVLRSEGEFSSDTGTSLVAFYPNTDTTGKAPKLLITYQ